MDYAYADLVRADILRMIPPDGKVVGSIGCGTAATEAVLMQQGREVHGVDIAPEAIGVARRRLASARLVSPGDPAPFEAGSLDGLILADVLEHIPAAWEVLKAYTKAVRPGGWVAISVPNMRQVEVLYQFCLRGDWPERPTGIFDRTHVQVMCKRRLRRWCQDAGLDTEKWFGRYRFQFGGPRRFMALRLCDVLTLGLVHSWFMYQLQVLCRTRFQSQHEPSAL